MLRTIFVTALFSVSSLISFSAENPSNPVSASAPGAATAPKISDEQRAKAREANEKFRTEQTALLEKLRNTRREMEKAVSADVIDENTIRAKSAVLGQIEGELAILRAKHAKELRAILPHDQAASPSSVSNQSAQRLQSVVRRGTNNPAIKPNSPNPQ